MNWLPIADAYTALVERGITEVEAAEGLTAKISTFALLIKPHRSFDRQYGPSWITNPIIDFRAGTIAMPLLPTPGTWDEISPRLTAVRVDVDQDQFDRLWPAPINPSAARRGAKPQYDWDVGEASIRKMLDERFDPTDEKNATPGWNSISSIAAALVECLTPRDGDGPDLETARPYARKFLKKWQQDQAG
jgi:hypothetical protein